MNKKNNLIEDYKRESKKKYKIKALSFFSGAMGLDIGLEKEGIHPLLACENDSRYLTRCLFLVLKCPSDSILDS